MYFGLWPCRGHEGPALIIVHPLNPTKDSSQALGVGALPNGYCFLRQGPMLWCRPGQLVAM